MVHDRTPVRLPKNSNAPFAILVLPIDLRSFVAIMRVLNELLMNPMVTVVAPPHFSKDQPASDRSSRNDDRPKMPDFRPGRFRAKAQYSDPFRIFSNVTHDLTIRLSRRAECDRRRLSLVWARTFGDCPVLDG